MDIAHNRQQAKYTKKELALRLLWNSVGLLLFRCSFRTFFNWRNTILRCFGATVGNQVHIYRTVDIYMPWNLEISDWSSIGDRAVIYNLGRVTIGKQVTISQRAHLCAGSHDYQDPAMPLLKQPITISDEAWVCTEAFVGPDVTVAEGAVIGARAVQTQNTDAWMVYAGNPAEAIKRRTMNPPA